MTDTPVALITGANKGIGAQIAKVLAAEGLTVLIGSRNIEKGRVVADTIGENAHAIQLDVTDQESVDAAAAKISEEFGRLDVLVNNAGISNVCPPGTPFPEIIASTLMSVASLDDMRSVYETNVFGPLAVAQAMLPLLHKAPAARIVNVSSGSGSLGLHTQPDNPSRQKFGVYSTSKTALNAVTLALSINLEKTNIKVNAVCPGFTSTALNNFQGTQTVEEGARQIVRMASLRTDVPHGTFTANSGDMPW